MFALRPSRFRGRELEPGICDRAFACQIHGITSACSSASARRNRVRLSASARMTKSVSRLRALNNNMDNLK